MKISKINIIVSALAIALKVSSYPIWDIEGTKSHHSIEKRSPYKVIDGIAGSYKIAPTLDVGEEIEFNNVNENESLYKRDYDTPLKRAEKKATAKKHGRNVSIDDYDTPLKRAEKKATAKKHGRDVSIEDYETPLKRAEKKATAKKHGKNEEIKKRDYDTPLKRAEKKATAKKNGKNEEIDDYETPLKRAEKKTTVKKGSKQ